MGVAKLIYSTGQGLRTKKLFCQKKKKKKKKKKVHCVDLGLLNVTLPWC